MNAAPAVTPPVPQKEKSKKVAVEALEKGFDITAGFVRPNLGRIVADHLRSRLGDPRFGDVLPGERELSTGFGVSRNSVRQALQILKKEGRLSRRQGYPTRILRDRL